MVFEVRNKLTREIENTLDTREAAAAFAAKMTNLYGIPCFVVAMIYHKVEV